MASGDVVSADAFIYIEAMVFVRVVFGALPDKASGKVSELYERNFLSHRVERAKEWDGEDAEEIT